MGQHSAIAFSRWEMPQFNLEEVLNVIEATHEHHLEVAAGRPSTEALNEAGWPGWLGQAHATGNSQRGLGSELGHRTLQRKTGAQMP